MQGTKEHDDMARAPAFVVGERNEKKRPGLKLGLKREKGDTAAVFPQEAPPGPGSPPSTLAP